MASQPSFPVSIDLWSRSDILLAAVELPPSALGEAEMTSRVFYWLDDDDTLARHVGQRVEIKGELNDLEKGKIEIDSDGDYTKIELDLDGKTEKARVPTAWLRGIDKDKEFDIAARRVDVKDVKVFGPCR